MTQLNETGSVIEMTPFKGIDGSTSITGTPEEYCRQLENCDLSTYKKLSKRPGYQVHSGILPIRMVNTYGNNCSMADYTYVDNIDSALYRIYPFTSAGLNNSIDNAEYLSTRSLEDNYFIIAVSLNPKNTPLFTMDTLIGTSPTSGASSYYFYPKAIYTYAQYEVNYIQYLVLTTYDYDQLRLAISPGYPRLAKNIPSTGQGGEGALYRFSAIKMNRLVETDISAVVNTVPGTVVVSYAGSEILLGARVYIDSAPSADFSSVNGAGLVTAVNPGVSFTVTGDATLTGIIKNYFSMRYTTPSRYGYYDSATSEIIYGTDLRLTSGERAIFSVPNNKSIYLYTPNYNAGTVNNLDVYQDGDYSKLVAQYSGQMFVEKPPLVVSTKIVTPPHYTSATRTVTGTRPNYRISATGIGAYYLLGDTLTATANTSSGVSTSKTMLVTGVSTDYIDVYYDFDSLTLTSEILHYTRTSNTIPVVVFGTTGGAIYYPGAAVQVGNYGNNYAVRVIKSCSATAEIITFEEDITFSSEQFVYKMSEWVPINSKLPILTPRKTPTDITRYHSAFFDSSLWYSTSDTGVWRYDGNSSYSQILMRPIIVTMRSVPNSRGLYGIVKGADNKKVGETQYFKFTYSYVDYLGRNTESCPTDMNEAIFTPNAAKDGTDYSELIEAVVLAPRNYRSYLPSTLYLNVYRSRTDIATGAELDYRLDYRLEKSIPFNCIQTDPVFPSDGITGGVLDPIYYTVTLGDTSSNSLQQIYSLVFTENIPAPKANYLISAGNRIVGLNSKTYPHISYAPDTLFSRVDSSTFNAGMELRFSVGKYNNAYNETTFGEKYLATGFVTVPIGVGNIPDRAGNIATGLTTANIYCDNLNYHATQAAANTNRPNGFYVSNETISGTPRPIIFTYSDVSHKFTINLSAASTLSTTASTVFRCLMRDPIPDIFPINFVEDEMLIATAGGSVSTGTAASNSKWTDVITAGGTPTSLSPYNAFAVFQFVAGIKPSDMSIVSEVPMAFASIKAEDSSATVYISSYAALTFVTGAYYVFKGLGTQGSFQDTNSNTQILSFDRDLVVKCTNSVATVEAVTGVNASVRNHNVYTFQVVKLIYSQAAATAVMEDPNFKPIAKSNVAYSEGKIDIFKCVYDTATGLVPLRCTFSGFNNPSTTMTISQASSSMGTTIYTNNVGVSQYVGLELNTADSASLSRYFPSMEGGFLVTSAPTADSITVIIPASYEVMNSTGTFTCSSGSYLTWLNYRISNYANGALRIRHPGTTAISANTFVYVCFRGYSYNSVNTDMSGYYLVSSSVQATLTVDGVLTLWRPWGKPMDYTRFSSTALSFMLRGTTGGYGSFTDPANPVIPIPVPYKNGAVEEIQDLAAPMYSATKSLASLPVNAISKRFAVAINYVLGEYLYATIEDLSDLGIASIPNGFTVVKVRETPTGGIRSGDSGTTNYGFKVVPNTSDTFEALTVYADNWKTIGVINGAYTSSYIGITLPTATYLAEVLRPNLIHYSDVVSTNVPSSFVAQFKRGATYDLGSTDDSEITGAVVYNNMLLVFKRNSIWRITFGDTIYSIAAQRVQSTVGSYSNNNLVATDVGVYFVHATGVYVTDGNSVQPIFKLNQPFDERVTKDAATLALGAGYCDQDARQLYLGVEYASDFSTPIGTSDGQFNYSYNDGVLGWQVNTHIDAVKWARLHGQSFFASTRGKVMRIRTELSLTKFNDEAAPIPFAIQTRFLTTDQGQKFKFYRNGIFQFGTTSNCNYVLYYSKDFKTALTYMDTIPITGQALSNGIPVYGNTRYLKGLRDTIGLRMAQISFTLTESSVDTDAPVYFMGVEGFLQNTRLMPQRRTPSDSSGQQR